VWTFLTNHTHVLLCICEDPGIRLRDVAQLVGITERAAQSIVADLVNEGYLSREKVGRRNSYQLHLDRPLRHPIERHHTVGELLAVLRERLAISRHLAAVGHERYAAGNGHGNGNSQN
jgi:predicted ArsR family transcriptional regulator